jgi:dTMP kinase
MLQKALEEKDYSILCVAEPDEDNPVGQFLRKCLKSGEYPHAHAQLFLADRMLLLHSKVIPALVDKKIVLSSRSLLSTLVYQQNHWSKDYLEKIHEGLPVRPGITFIFDISPYLAVERLKGRGIEAECYEAYGTLAQARKRYLEYAQSSSGFTFVVDAAGTPEQVHQEVMAILEDIGFFTNYDFMIQGKEVDGYRKVMTSFDKGIEDEESDETSTETGTETGNEGETEAE